MINFHKWERVKMFAFGLSIFLLGCKSRSPKKSFRPQLNKLSSSNQIASQNGVNPRKRLEGVKTFYFLQSSKQPFLLSMPASERQKKKPVITVNKILLQFGVKSIGDQSESGLDLSSSGIKVLGEVLGELSTPRRAVFESPRAFDAKFARQGDIDGVPIYGYKIPREQIFDKPIEGELTILKIDDLADLKFMDGEDELLIVFSKNETPEPFAGIDLDNFAASKRTIDGQEVAVTPVRAQDDLAIFHLQKNPSAIGNESLKVESEFLSEFQATKVVNQLDGLLLEDAAFNDLAQSLPPIAKIEIEGQRNFYISEVFSSDQREFALLYTREGEQIIGRTVYHSESDGTWRAVPFILFEGSLSKGSGTHYTQETKIHPSINGFLDEMRAIQTKDFSQTDFKGSRFLRIKDGEAAKDAALKTFTQQVKPKKFSESVEKRFETLRSCQPGECFHKRNSAFNIMENKKKVLSYLEDVNEALDSEEFRGFVPSFKEQVDAYYFQHPLLGRTKVEVYQGRLDDQPVEWHMASDKDGRVWIDRILDPTAEVSPFGTRSEFIDSGILTNKPLEYPDQSYLLIWTANKQNIGWTQRFGDKKSNPVGYLDITNFIDELNPIKQYRSARGIEKKI